MPRTKAKAIFDGGLNLPLSAGAGKILTSDGAGDGTWQAPAQASSVLDTDAIGTINAYAGSTIPTNWMLADGRALSRGSYPQLFSAIGIAYGAGDGSTTFNIPDLLSRMLVGAGAGTGLTNRAAGAAGGEERHILTTAELAAHSHTMVAGGIHDHQLNTAGDGVSSGSGGGYAARMTKNSGTSVGLTNDSASHTHTINNSGSGTSHENMPPWCAVAYIIKVTGVTIDAGGALVGATGPQGPQGPQGDQGVQGDVGPTGPSFTTANEGTMDFSPTGATYTVPDRTWGTPGWFAPIVVGPNQIWEVISLAGVYCVTAVGNCSSRVDALSSAGGAVPSGVVVAQPISQMTHPNTAAFARNLTAFGRVVTDGTVPANTTIRVISEFYGGDANSRVLRDGSYYRHFAWRRV